MEEFFQERGNIFERKRSQTGFGTMPSHKSAKGAKMSGCPPESNPSAPLFEIGPAGNLRPDPLWKGEVSDFCDAVKAEVGADPRVRCWPYRIGDAVFVAFDVTGRSGDVSLTIVEGDYIEIPMQGKALEGTDPVCLVVDMVDAFYLVSTLLEALGLPGVFGGRTMAR